MKKSNLDEMQEQKLLQIEHRGYSLAYASLTAAILIQAILWGDFFSLVGEVTVLLVMCFHIIVNCLRSGIWDRHLKPNWRTNLLCSLIGTAVVAVSIYLMFSRQTDDQTVILVFTIGLSALTFILCFCALTICAKLYQKRRQELDSE